MAGRACHVVGSTTQVGLTQALDVLDSHRGSHGDNRIHHLRHCSSTCGHLALGHSLLHPSGEWSCNADRQHHSAFFLSLVVVAVSGISHFHPPCIYQVSVVIGLLSLEFHFSILSVPGRPVLWFACFGLDKEEVQSHKQRLEKANNLVKQEDPNVNN